MHGHCPLVVLYVSADMRVIWMGGKEAQYYARDLYQQDSDRLRHYRRLGLPYYVWLAERMHAAALHHQAGRITDQAMGSARMRMDLVQTWIELFYTQQQITAALSAGARSYAGPAVKVAA